ncbi:unnamed protein product [Lampetra planeri]
MGLCKESGMLDASAAESLCGAHHSPTRYGTRAPHVCHRHVLRRAGTLEPQESSASATLPEPASSAPLMEGERTPPTAGYVALL